RSHQGTHPPAEPSSRPQSQATPGTGATVYAQNGTQAGPIHITRAQRAAMAAEARGIAALLGSRDIVQLDTTNSALLRAAPGRNWSGAVSVATPQLLRAYGISASQINPNADILTMRPGLSGMTKMQLHFGAYKFGAGNSWPCPPSSCLANPVI